MTNPTQPKRRTILAALLSLSFLAAPAALAQDEKPPEKPGDEKPEGEAPPAGEPEAGGGPDEIAEIIKAIESHMAEAERLLTAREAGTATQEAQETAAELLKKLLDQAGKQQASALSSIDKLLELTAKQSQQSQQQRGGKSGRQMSEEEKQRERERRAEEELSRKKPEGQEPKDGREAKSPEQEGEDKNGRKKPPQAGSERVNHPDASGKWGNLPRAVQARIEQGSWESFPPEYRDKLAKWYKRITAEEK